MEPDRQRLLKHYRQVATSTARLEKMLSGNSWPLKREALDRILSCGAIVEGIKIEHKTTNRRAPSTLSALSMCIVRQDIDSLEKLLAAPFLDQAAFTKDVVQAWWMAINSKELPAVKLLASRPALMTLIPAPEALSLFSNALHNDFTQAVEIMIDAGMGPGIGQHELVGRTQYEGMFAFCRSAEAVSLLVSRGVSPQPPAGHENSLSDLAQLLDRASYKDLDHQSGAVRAVVELIKMGYPLDNITADRCSTFTDSLVQASYRMKAPALAPLVPYLDCLLPCLSSRSYYSPTGPATLLDAGFDLDLERVAKNWSSWLSGNHSCLDKPSLLRLLDAGMPGPAQMSISMMSKVDEYDRETGELDTHKCLLLVDLGLPLGPEVKTELLSSQPELKDRVEAGVAIASARNLDRKTRRLDTPGLPRRM